METTPATGQVPEPYGRIRGHSCGGYRGYRNYRRFRSSRQPFPLANITETADAYVLEIVAPGRRKEDFTLTLKDRVVTIAAQVSPTAEPWQNKYDEFRLVPFKRTFELAEDANAETLQASYKDGVLVVRVDKNKQNESAPDRVIEVG